MAGILLAEHGLIPQTNNCLRMGLESEWIGIVLIKNKELGHCWTFGLGDETIIKGLKDLEKSFMVRRVLGDTTRIKIKDREEIYMALSDKSHTKLSSVARSIFPTGSALTDGYIDCIPLGGMQEENDIKRIRLAVKTVLTFALADIDPVWESASPAGL